MLRLTSLQIDLNAFSSTYARELALSEDVWRERLDSTFKQIFVASVLYDAHDASHKRRDVHKGAGETSNVGNQPADTIDMFCLHQLLSLSGNARVHTRLEDLPSPLVSSCPLTSEWIGTARIIGPMGTDPSLNPFKETGVGANWKVYGLSAMWVQPAHRGKGVGAQLVKACLEWARTNIDTKFSSDNSGNFENVVVLLVYDNSVAGRTLYSRTGLTDLKGVTTGEGQRWMLVKV